MADAALALAAVTGASRAPHSPQRAGGRKRRRRRPSSGSHPHSPSPPLRGGGGGFPACFPRRFLLRSARAAQPGVNRRGGPIGRAGRGRGVAAGGARRSACGGGRARLTGARDRGRCAGLGAGDAFGRRGGGGFRAGPAVRFLGPTQGRVSCRPCPAGSSRGSALGVVSSCSRCCAALPPGRAPSGCCLLWAGCPERLALGPRRRRKG